MNAVNYVRKSALFATLISILFVAYGCGSSSSDDGACTRGSGITRSCGDDFSRGECDLINGTFHEDRTCADLGFSSS